MGTTATYVHVGIREMATALAAFTGDHTHWPCPRPTRPAYRVDTLGQAASVPAMVNLLDFGRFPGFGGSSPPSDTPW